MTHELSMKDPATDCSLHVRVPAAMRAALERAAAQNERTVSQEVRYRLGPTLDARQSAAGA
jgi:hypothetical protein